MSKNPDSENDETDDSSMGEIDTHRRLDPKSYRDDLVAIPKQIGPYKVLELIGHGGMGQVFLAEQLEPVKRRVALKVIRTETPSKEIIARFEAERQALAMMDHQNIAKVLDAGITSEGRPFFAMELVKGIPITDYCDENRLSPEERLELFVQVCRAMQHAHQKQILHRDLKPSNILVTVYEGKPLAKVIDFGLAKAMEDSTQLANRTLFTQRGQVLGTLAYMSPEQARINAMDVDTQTDVYSLGVILYELLTGSTPITSDRIKTEAFDKVLSWIREEETQRPSTRLIGSGNSIHSISDLRKTDPRKLNSMLRGDLDWIAMKALEKDRARRYNGPAALADDVIRFLEREPIEARPPSFSYRFGKAIRKNTGLFAGIGAFAVVLITALIVCGALWSNASENAHLYKNESIKSAARAEDLAKALEKNKKLVLEKNGLVVEKEKAAAEAATFEEIQRAIAQGRSTKIPILRLLLAIYSYDLIEASQFPVPENLQRLVETMIREGIQERPGRLVKFQEERIEKYGRTAHGLMMTSGKGLYFFGLDRQGIAKVNKVDGESCRGIVSSSDGETVYSAHYGPIKVWKYVDRRWVLDRTLQAPDDGTYYGQALGISADNHWLVCSNWKGQIAVFDLTQEKLEPPKIFSAKPGTPVWEISVSSSGCVTRQNNHYHWISFVRPSDQFKVGTEGGTVHPSESKIVSAEDGKLILWEKDEADEWKREIVDAKRNETRVFRFSPKGRYLATTADDGVVRLWDWKDPDWKTPYLIRPDSNATACDFSTDEGLLAVGTERGTIEVWNMNRIQDQDSISFASHGKRVEKIAFLDQQSFCSADGYGGVRVNHSDRKSFFGLDYSSEGGATLSSDQKWIVSGFAQFLPTYFTGKSTPAFLKSRKGSFSFRLNSNGQEVFAAEFSPGSDSLLVRYSEDSYENQTSSLFTFQNKNVVRTDLKGFRGNVLATRWSDDSKKLVLVSPSHLGCWIKAQEQWVKQFVVERKLSEPKVDRDLTAVVGIELGKPVWISLENPEKGTKLSHPLFAKRTALSPNGKHLAIIDSGKNLVVWDLTSRQKIIESPIGADYGEMEFHPQGDRLAVGVQKRLLIFDLPSQVKKWELGFAHRLRAVRFVPKMDRLVVLEAFEPGVQEGGTLSFERMKTIIHFVDLIGEEPELKTSPSTNVSSFRGPVFSPSGQWMSCDDKNGGVYLWNAHSKYPQHTRRQLGQHPQWVKSRFLDDELLFSNSDDGRTVIRDLNLARVTQRLKKQVGRRLTETELIQFGLKD